MNLYLQFGLPALYLVVLLIRLLRSLGWRNTLAVVPVLLSWIVLAAHFMRSGHPVLLAAALLMPALLLVRRPWVPLLMQLGLFLGALEWIRTLMALSAMRQMAAAPAGRMILILGGVAVFTGASALAFLTPSLRRRYRLGQPPQAGAAAPPRAETPPDDTP